VILNAASKIVSKLVDADSDKKIDRDNIIKTTLGLADTGIPIGREDEPAGYVRWNAAKNDTFNAGQSTSGDKGHMRYHEFLWTNPRP